MKSDTTAIVVTHNRHRLLLTCIEALRNQTLQPDKILIIDNASTDGTQEWLAKISNHECDQLCYVRLSENMGGAGGFSEGIKKAINFTPNWMWLMDDDAKPSPRALESLCSIERENVNIYGSATVSGDRLAWPIPLADDKDAAITQVADIPEIARVTMHPFLGFTIHRELVRRIGLPDSGFFIAADDVEYCTRAKTRTRASIFVVGNSRIEHPPAKIYKVGVLGKKLTCLKIAPWKRYYDTRNRLLIARKYYGFRLLTETIPGSFIRLFATLINESNKRQQLWAFAAGFVDGLIGRKGRLHGWWRISQ